MDLDLLTNILRERQPASTRDLLSNLPRSSLTRDSHDTRDNAAEQSITQESRSTQPTFNQASTVVSRIENIFESITDSIHQEKNDMVIKLKTGRKQGNQILNDRYEALQTGVGTKKVRFPSKSPREAWKFTALLRILELSHEALVRGVVTTKRDIYYRDPELFMNQAVVDRYVDDIAYTFGVDRDALNIVAAAKGLIAGSFSVQRKDNSIIDYQSEPEGSLVPSTKDINALDLRDVRWILVIEKEATFRTLATNKYWRKFAAGQGIIITAKGYPDIQTRQLLHLLSTTSPRIPIYCLVDFDPDGIGIMSTYKYGSLGLAHQNQGLAVPSVRWLGVRSSDIVLREGDDKVGLMGLTNRDRRIARRMLERTTMEEGGKEVEWRRELQVMLMLDLKAEIQILSDGDGGWSNGSMASC